MGIRGLSTYVRQSSIGRSVDLENCTVIIDCWALVHFLYTQRDFDKYYGGESYNVYKAVRDFVLSLKEYNVKIFVVRDGSIDVRTKENTKLKRMNQLLDDKNSYPPVRFSLEYYYACIVSYVCQLEECEYFVSTGEADREIAIFSDYTDAYILSNDSDFYIYNSRGGYVSLESLSKEQKGPFRGVEIKYTDLMSHFSLTNDALIAFAISCGNDACQTYDLGNIFPPNVSGRDRCRVTRVVNYVKSFRKIGSIVLDISSMLLKGMRSSFCDQFRQSFNSYDIQSDFGGFTYSQWIEKIKGILSGLKVAPKFSYENTDVKRAFLDNLFYRGDLSAEMRTATKFGYIFLTIPPQNKNLYSVNDTSLNIRKAIYRLLYIKGESLLEVLEYDRKQSIYSRQNLVKFNPLEQSEIMDISSRPFNYFLGVISLSYIPQNMRHQINDLRCPLLLVYILKYVWTNTKLAKEELLMKSLFLGCVRCLVSQDNREELVHGYESKRYEVCESNLIHLIGEFVTVTSNIHTLNLILGNPIKPIPYIYWLDGPLIVDAYFKILEDPNYICNELNRLQIIKDSFNLVLSWILSTH